MLRNVTVFCASSTRAGKVYQDAAYRLGELLARAGHMCYYGGGSVGLMGQLSRAMVENGGEIVGIIPQFMVDEGWDNSLVREVVVADMQERKKLLLQKSDAVVALPGGIGTIEELVEALVSRQLGLIKSPVYIVNINGFFDPLIDMLSRCVEQNFMRSEHRGIWTIADSVDDVVERLGRDVPAGIDRSRAQM